MNARAYETSDLSLSAYLVASDTCQLTDITSDGNSRKRFHFDPAPTKEQLVEFYSGQALVSARRLAEAFATLKGSGYTMRAYT